MAKYGYNDFISRGTNSTNNQAKKEYKVGFFNSLKDEGDQTIVRFAYSSASELEFATVHSVMAGKTASGKDLWKKVSCLRGPFDSLDKCPFCAKKNAEGKSAFPQMSKVYVKLVEYSKDENGKVVGKAVVWERPAKFVNDLSDYFEAYGDLSKQLFKVIRHGAKGNRETTYTIIPVPESPLYKPEIYSAEALKDFDDYKIEGRQYLTKTADDMKTYLDTGKFPEWKPENKLVSESKNLDSVDTTGADEALGFTEKVDTVEVPARQVQSANTVPQEDSPIRPRRYY